MPCSVRSAVGHPLVLVDEEPGLPLFLLSDPARAGPDLRVGESVDSSFSSPSPVFASTSCNMPSDDEDDNGNDPFAALHGHAVLKVFNTPFAWLGKHDDLLVVMKCMVA